MGLFGKKKFGKRSAPVSDVERERLWTEKRRAEEEAWARAHPGITASNAALAGDFSRTPWLAPGGDPAENAAFADAFGMMGRNRERSAANAASIDSYGDPIATHFARTKARIASGSDMAQAFANFKQSQAARRFGALQSMLGQQYGANQDEIARRSGMDMGRSQANAGMAGAGGDLLAALLPAFIKAGW